MCQTRTILVTCYKLCLLNTWVIGSIEGEPTKLFHKAVILRVSHPGCVTACQWWSQSRQRASCLEWGIGRDWAVHLRSLPLLTLIWEPTHDFWSCASHEYLNVFFVSTWCWHICAVDFNSLPYSEPLFSIFNLCSGPFLSLFFSYVVAKSLGSDFKFRSPCLIPVTLIHLLSLVSVPSIVEETQ